MTDEQKRYLFLKQVRTLKTLKAHGAISDRQYDISYNGLVTKMGVTQSELDEWEENCAGEEKR